jgi:hypothetical protein
VAEGVADPGPPLLDAELPPHWVVRTIGENEKYYFNTVTNATSWEHPGRAGVDPDSLDNLDTEAFEPAKRRPFDTHYTLTVRLSLRYVSSHCVHAAKVEVPDLPSLKSNVHPIGPSDCIQRLSYTLMARVI